MAGISVDSVSEAPDVFVSYTQADRPWGEWIAWVLEEAGFSTVLQAWDFAAGENFLARMQRASAEAKRTVTVLSPDYERSQWGEWEWTTALAQGRLVPVRVRDFDPVGLLKVAVYVDLVGLDEEVARARLVAEIERRGQRDKPAGRPTFPGNAMARAAAPRFPGSLPGIWNVPPVRSPSFTGREEELLQLQATLRLGRAVALTGLGGVGKSQLAVQLAHRCAADMELVWWVTAEPSTIVRDLATLAARLGLPEAESVDEPAAAAAARQALEQRGAWLLVFDNAAEPHVVRPWLPQAQTGEVLITSRHAAWRAVADDQPVGPLDREAASRLLERRGGQHDPVAAAALAERLGGLPLAIEQAGAYIEATGMAATEYLQLFDARRRELLARPAEPEAPTVATTWELSFQRLHDHAPVAADLLTLAAFLAPEDIPRALMSDRAALPESLASVSDPLGLSDAFAALGRYSLIAPIGDAFSVHRLVQDVTRDRLPSGTRRSWAAAAVGLLEASFPFRSDDPSTWAPAGRLLPHALRACHHAQLEHGALELTGALLTRAGSYLWQRADYADAQTVLEQALRITEEAYGPDHSKLAYVAGNLGVVLHARGDFDGAQAAYERVLLIAETAQDPDQPTVATAVNNLGEVLRARGDLDGAQAAYQRALQIDESVHGPDHPSVARDISNLGLVRHARGDLDGAGAAFERALRIADAVHGPDHPEIGRLVAALGQVLLARGDLAGAEASFQRALRIDEGAYDPDHPVVARDLTFLGDVLSRRGNLDGAEAILRRAVAIDEGAYGADHPELATAVNNLGNVLRGRGALDHAQAAYERALRIDEAAYGPGHPAVARDLTGLGDVLHARGDLDGAQAVLGRAIAIDEATYGLEHPEVATVVSAFGQVLLARGDLTGAEACFERALRIDEGAYGADHPSVARDLSGIGATRRARGDIDGARAAFEQALRILESALGIDHPHTAGMRVKLAAVSEL